MIMGSPKKIRRIVEILAEFLGDLRCTRNQKFQFRPEPYDIIRSGVRFYMKNGQQCGTQLDQCKENIAQHSLMRLVNDERRITSQVGFCQELPREKSVSYVFEDHFIACRVFKSD